MKRHCEQFETVAKGSKSHLTLMSLVPFVQGLNSALHQIPIDPIDPCHDPYRRADRSLARKSFGGTKRNLMCRFHRLRVRSVLAVKRMVWK